MVLVAVSFSLQITVSAQTTYITVYGQLTQFQCPVGAVSGPCTGFSLTTNGTTPGIPNSPMLDFSQSVVPAPAQSDVGRLIMATGYYGQESPCTIVTSCPALFVHTWGPYYGPSIPTLGTGFTSSNPPTTCVSVQCNTALTSIAESTPQVGGSSMNSLQTNLSYSWIAITIVLIILLGYVITHREK
jgi:hypothetical protein